MGNISHAWILSIFLVVTSFFTSNNAELLIPHPLPHTAPAPSPTSHHHHHHHLHHPGGGHHHHAHAPTVAPSYSTAPSPAPSKPVVPKPPVTAKPPTTTYPAPSVPPVKPPSQPPVKPPTTKPSTPPPNKPPTYPPVKPPTVKPPTAAPVPYTPPSIQKKYVAVQGMVYCKNNCTYAGIDTLLGASPLSGARVVMRCRNTKYLLRKIARTDKNGYFFMQAPPSVTTYGAHRCKVYLAREQKTSLTCTHASKLNNGDTGAFLNKTVPPTALPTFSLFTVGPFVYEPVCYKH